MPDTILADLLIIAKQPTFSDAEKPFFVAAAAASLLSYSEHPARDLAHSPTFAEVYRLQLLSSVWVIDHPDSTVLVAWSPHLATAFIAFRGSVSVSDWLDTNLRLSPALDSAYNWAAHEGFYARASKLPVQFIESIIRKHRTVLCGHSLGY